MPLSFMRNLYTCTSQRVESHIFGEYLFYWLNNYGAYIFRNTIQNEYHIYCFLSFDNCFSQFWTESSKPVQKMFTF